MSKAKIRLETIASKMQYIEEIIASYGSITAALEDQKQGAAAIFMHLTSIAEQFDELAKEGEYALLQHFDKHDLKGTYDIRNYIVHDYEGINYAVIERILREKIPHMHETVKMVLEGTDNDSSNE